MRLEIKTDGTQFRVASAAKPRPDYKDKSRQATMQDGRPIWTVRLDAVDAERETKETIWVEVAGDEPKLTFDEYAVVRGLVLPRGSGVTARSSARSAPMRSSRP